MSMPNRAVRMPVLGLCAGGIATGVLLSCGARTGLEVDAGADVSIADSGPEVSGDHVVPEEDVIEDVVPDRPIPPDARLCPPAPDPSAPLSAAALAETLPVVATSGCSFAGAWIDNRGGRLEVDVIAYRPLSGAWQASSVVTVAKASTSATAPWLAWDGSDFAVVWADGTLWVAHVAEDGTVAQAPFDTAIKVPAGTSLFGLQSDGTSLRIGLEDDAAKPFINEAYFAMTDLHGNTILAPTLVTPPGQDVTTPSFVMPGMGQPNAVLWVGDGTAHLDLTSFDDKGTASMQTLERPQSGFQLTWQSLASRDTAIGGSLFAGAWTSGRSLDIVQLTPQPDGGFTTQPIRSVPGGTAPALALLGSTLGVLATQSSFGPADLLFSTVSSATVIGTTHVSKKVGPSNYALAGGLQSFGIFWVTTSAVTFTTVTP